MDVCNLCFGYNTPPAFNKRKVEEKEKIRRAFSLKIVAVLIRLNGI